jgi:hypothetical protein
MLENVSDAGHLIVRSKLRKCSLPRSNPAYSDRALAPAFCLSGTLLAELAPRAFTFQNGNKFCESHRKTRNQKNFK